MTRSELIKQLTISSVKSWDAATMRLMLSTPKVRAAVNRLLKKASKFCSTCGKPR